MSNFENEQRFNLRDMLLKYECKVRHPEMNLLLLWYSPYKGLYQAEKGGEKIEIINEYEANKRIRESEIIWRWNEAQKLQNMEYRWRGEEVEDANSLSYIRQHYPEVFSIIQDQADELKKTITIRNDKEKITIWNHGTISYSFMPIDILDRTPHKLFENDYVEFLEVCILAFNDEIFSNIARELDDTLRIKYLQEILDEINSYLERKDNVKYDLQKEPMTNFLDKFKTDYSKYLDKKFLEPLVKEEKKTKKNVANSKPELSNSKLNNHKLSESLLTSNPSFQQIVFSLNSAFFRLENFMNGTLNEYQYYGFNDVFTLLFKEGKKPENYTYDNCKLIGQYWNLTEQVRYDYDKGNYENQDAQENEMFIADCNELYVLNLERIEEFLEFTTQDEIDEQKKKFSITDILNKSNDGQKSDLNFKQIINESLNVNLFFEQIKDCIPTKIEQYNYVEKLTDNFNLEKLKLLHDDFEIFLLTAKDEREADFSYEDELKAINELKERKKPIPYKSIPDISKFSKENRDNILPNIDIIDLEKLLFPFEFFCCYQFKNFLVTEYNNRKGRSTKQNEASIIEEMQPTQKVVVEGKKSSKELSKPTKEINIHEDIIDRLIGESKKYFQKSEHENLEMVLRGESIDVKLLFLHNQNQWADVFKRLEYNNHLSNSKTEISDWLCKYFQYTNYRTHQVSDFNYSTVWGIISQGKEPTKKKRIIVFDWLPYKSPTQLGKGK